MIRNYLQIALRTISRQGTYTFINISGLSLAMACALMIILWVRHELSYDQFHQNKNDLYRIIVEWEETGNKSANLPGLLAETIKAEVPEVIESARIHKGSRSSYVYEDKAFYEDQVGLVDASLFKMLNIPLNTGDADAMFPDMGALVLTQSAKERYFGGQSAVGQTINWNNWADLYVSAVVEDIPGNSHLQFSIFQSHQRAERFWKNGYSWTNFIHETYIQLTSGADVKLTAQKIADVLRENSPKAYERLSDLWLQPLTDIHLETGINTQHAKVGDIKYVYIFSIVAFFILLIACLNFTNLATAQALKRVREVGVRKAIGAQRGQLVIQFLAESLFMVTVAFVLAMLLVEIFLPAFNLITDKQLFINYSDIWLIGMAIVVILATTVLSGLYPAFYLSGFKPSAILKGGISSSRTGFLRKGLVLIQFVLSIILITGAIVVRVQLDYMRNTNLGFDKENIIYIPAKGDIGKQYLTVRNDLLSTPAVEGVTIKESLPMVSLNSTELTWKGQDQSVPYTVETIAIDEHFFSMMKMNLVDGRNFSIDNKADLSNAVIINEEIAEAISFESVIGEQVTVAGGNEVTIVGVVENAHFKSLHHGIGPQVFYLMDDYGSSNSLDLFGIVMMKISDASAIDGVRKVWQKFNPQTPFEYHFLDDTINQQYTFEEKVSAVANYFTIIAVVISCLGLFGLSALSAKQKTKEVGIRKVLGASLIHLMRRLSSEFIKITLLANLIALPLAWFIMKDWLNSFSYHIEIMFWWLFVVAITTCLLALFTVTTHTYRTARLDPVKTIRND
ncbi:MAG: ABC transporter permease [Bacteroidota bacterium]